MKYRLRRAHDQRFVPLREYVKMSDSEIPRVSQVPHYSDEIEAATIEELAAKVEFLGTAIEEDCVVDEAWNEVATIGCELAIPYLILPDGRKVVGPELRTVDPGGLGDEDYAREMYLKAAGEVDPN